ncbi:MAG: energy transducer TonB [Oceanicaulis sp.]|uniref:energy transducer TonB n=1 Tax=Glycocaulis sp. TaxID=1969725 RepID=UPI0025BEE1D7|nr:energy transducer TonB [Glycocaulis sp.]MCC5981623.1 energy transducer TonB [Oceanicaulis sp.]MCH8522522.1 energy transducer TonB [Glycocaulis sp.]
MASLIRLIVSVPLAAIITFLLFTLMQILIFEDSVPLDDAGDELRISIADRVEDIAVRDRTVTVDDVDQVEPPPPPPQIERARADQPTESMSTIVGGLPEFDRPSLAGGDISFDVSDRDAQPLVRIPPNYPVRAAERGIEGRCEVTFDVTPEGNPTNVRILSCTNSLFERETIRAVERWRYEPRVQDGVAQWRRGVVTHFDYNLE